MDEVLKALNEKESLLDSNNSPEKKSDDNKEEVNGSSFNDVFSSPDGFTAPSIAPVARERSLSPPKEVQSPPPLPTQPPRIVSFAKNFVGHKACMVGNIFLKTW